MSENQIIHAPPAGSLRLGTEPYPPAGPGHGAPPANPLKMVHSFFRGHYLALIIMVAVLAPLGTWLGYRCGDTQYRSTGVLRFNPVGQVILYNNELNGQTPMFSETLDAEAHRMMSTRVINQSLEDQNWAKWNPTLPKDFANRIAEELQVTHQPGSELLTVTVWDPDQQVAVTAVSSIISAYQQIYDEEEADSDNSRLTALTARQEKEQSDVQEDAKQILDLARSNGLGTDDLTKAYDAKEEEFTKLREQYLAYQQSLGLNVRPAGSTETEDEAIASANPSMAEAMKQRDGYKLELKTLQLDGYGDQNPAVKVTKNHLEVVNDEIQQYRLDYERSRIPAPLTSTAALVPGGASGNAPTTRPDPLVGFKHALEVAAAELNQIGTQKLELEKWKEKKAADQAALDFTTKRLDSLRTESDNQSARLEVVSSGEAAVHSGDIKDTHAALGALGGGMGITISLAVVSLLSLRDRRFHGPEDTQYSQVRVPMLGMLPTLSSELTDPEQAAMAAHFVHGIRAALQFRANGEAGRVLAITSPSPHNGKTSLSLALGVSYAGAHSRTLLIDCDFVGRALSSRINAVAHPRLGRVLRHQGLVNEKNLQQALDAAQTKGKRLGEALLDMGVVTREKLDAALTAQKNQAFGVLEAIDGEDLAECVTPTDIPGLSVLPLGQANAEHIGSLSPAMLRQVLETCRLQYDVVIVDTGPILGSLEAAMVATQADDVVVVLSSGENRAAAERSIRYLDSVGAKVAGFVFNRAASRDFVRSDTASRVSSSANRWTTAKNLSPTSSSPLTGFGPVARAVARSVGEVSNSKSNGNGKAGVNGNNGVNGDGNAHSVPLA
jgi:polysaccharide biosynthesis transport protein